MNQSYRTALFCLVFCLCVWMLLQISTASSHILRGNRTIELLSLNAKLTTATTQHRSSLVEAHVVWLWCAGAVLMRFLRYVCVQWRSYSWCPHCQIHACHWWTQIQTILWLAEKDRIMHCSSRRKIARIEESKTGFFSLQNRRRKVQKCATQYI
jgi:hypothetical protein